MYGLLCRNAFKGMLLFFCVPWVLLGCGDFDREYGAGGIDDSGSVLNVEWIAPTYLEESTDGPAQVDIFRDNCEDDPAEPPDPEPYSDHFAEIAMTNRSLPNSPEQTNTYVYLDRYEMRYSPVTQGTGPLLTFIVNLPRQTVGIDPCAPGGTCQETSFIATYVPVRIKDQMYQFLQANPTMFQLHYNVHYIFRGQNDFGFDVYADGFSTFYATNYDHCGG